MIFIWFSLRTLDDKFGFAELGQRILKQFYTFMRLEKLERCLKVEGIEHSAPWYYRRIYSKLAIKNQQTSPHAPRSENSPWAIAARLFILANVLVASYDRSSEDFIWSLARSAFSRSTFWTFKQFFGYSWSKIIEPLTISKSRWFLMEKYNFFYKRWPTISRH